MEQSIRYCVLASGSKGNALYVEAGGRAVLVDCGLSGKELLRRLDTAGLDPGRINAILVSHEHRDHVLGVGVAARKLKIPVYLNPRTARRLGNALGPADFYKFETGQTFELAGLTIHPFSVSHDAADPVGFTFTYKNVKLGLATDLGEATKLVRHRLVGCHGLIMEANHDITMLDEGPYPWETKRRVKGRHGHLSNEDAAALLEELVHRDLISVTLAHLSETNNLPQLPLELASAALNGQCRLSAASQSKPGEVEEI